MNNEIEETAKAIQEVAKTTRTGIEATQQVGGFLSRIINEPLEAVVGRLTDKLQFIRAERQLRLVERWRDILKERKIEGVLRIVPPKLASQSSRTLRLKRMMSYKIYGQTFLRQPLIRITRQHSDRLSSIY